MSKITNYYNGNGELYKTVTMSKVNGKKRELEVVDESIDVTVEKDDVKNFDPSNLRILEKNKAGDIMRHQYIPTSNDKVKCLLAGSDLPIMKFRVLKQKPYFSDIYKYSLYKKYYLQDGISTRSKYWGKYNGDIYTSIQVIEVDKNHKVTYTLIVELSYDYNFIIAYRFEDLLRNDTDPLNSIIKDAFTSDGKFVEDIFSCINYDNVNFGITNIDKEAVEMIINKNGLRFKYSRFEDNENELVIDNAKTDRTIMSMIFTEDVEEMIEYWLIKEEKDVQAMYDYIMGYQVKIGSGESFSIRDWIDVFNVSKL